MTGTSPKVIISRWAEPDRADLHSVFMRMHAESRYAFLAYDEPKVNAWIDLHLTDQQHRFCAIERNDFAIAGVFAGYVTQYFFSAERVAHDQVIYVVPSRRGGRTAVRLIRAFRQWACQHGAREMILSTMTGVQPLRTGAFFQRLGCEFIGGTYAERLARI